MKYVVAITGASGSIYGIRLLEELPDERAAVITEEGKKIMEYETGRTPADLSRFARVYDERDMEAGFSSGSNPFDALIIAPASMNTVSKIACGISDNLVTRAASVALKERKRLVLLPRETPVSAIHLSNMARLAEMGADIVLPSPAFYIKPESVNDCVDFIVGRVLDVLGISHELYPRWKH